MDDDALVAAQIGRVPRGSWIVAARCSYEHPTVIQTAPVLDTGELFPTLFWLTCPHLTALVSAQESAGGAAHWAEAVASDPALQARVLAADAEYRERRVLAGAGGDPCGDVGVAGQSRPQGTKCLHAHVAALLAGIDDPVGQGVLEGMVVECDDDRCARFGEADA